MLTRGCFEASSIMLLIYLIHPSRVNFIFTAST